MRRLIQSVLIALLLFGAYSVARTSEARAGGWYVEYYRDNLFLGLAYHRIGCDTDWYTIQSGQEYDGFTNYNYCNQGTSSNSVPSGEWFDWDYVHWQGELDYYGDFANWSYDTPNYQDHSNTCSYNVLLDCNSDCWIRNFSDHQGWEVDSVSGCWGSPPRGDNLY